MEPLILGLPRSGTVSENGEKRKEKRPINKNKRELETERKIKR
jgi:hypothetical protein